MNNITDILNWLSNRMVFKYKEPRQSQSIDHIQKLLNVFTNISECNLTDEEIDTIIQKYFFDHGFDSGDTDYEKSKFRTNIKNIYIDTVSNIINKVNDKYKVEQNNKYIQNFETSMEDAINSNNL
jgi:hypothetical protein